MYEQLTIVLTIKDRTAFTYRWMRYMNDIKCPYPILIADGGEDRIIESHLGNHKNYPNLNYTYIRYPYDVHFSAFYKKFIDVINRVSTSYLLFADNDDFFLLENTTLFLKFLEDNLDFVSCGGLIIWLSLLTDKGEISNTHIAKKYIANSFWKNRVEKSILSNGKLGGTIDSDAGLERFSYFMKNVQRYNLWNSWYMIHRTSAIKKSVDFLNYYEFKEFVALEIHVHLSLLLTGKYMQFNLPFYVRQTGTSQVSMEISKTNNLIERFIINNAFDEIHKSIDAFIPTLSENEKVKIYNAIAHWFANYSIATYTLPKNIKTEIKEIGRIIYQIVRMAFGPQRPVFKLIRRFLWLNKNDTMRLPIVEKYILEDQL